MPAISPLPPRGAARLTVAAAALLAAAPAAAEIGAEELWSRWQALAEQSGQTISVDSQSFQGGVLTLDGITVTMEVPDGQMRSTIDQMVMTEQSGGTVAITASPSYRIEIDGETPEGKPSELSMVVEMTGLEMTASGTAEATNYELAAERIGIGEMNVTEDGRQIPVTMQLALIGVGGAYEVGTGETLTTTGRIAADELALGMEFEDPAEGSFVMQASYVDIASDSRGTAGSLAMLGDPAALTSGKLDIAGSISHGGGGYQLEGAGPDGEFVIESSSASGELDFALTGETISYSGGGTGLSMRLMSDQIPFPELTAEMEAINFGFAVPVAQTDAPSDFRLLIDLAGLSVSDALWGMIDPFGNLPRDPATLVVDLAGQMRLTADIADPSVMASPQPPGELHALDIRELRLDLAGAELTGSGGFTFDNSDLMTFGGVPAPTGSLDLSLTGAGALMEKLVAMGLLPEEQAMGAQMMLGMFAKPVGPDALETSIEVKGDGSISANGQRLQ